MRQPAQGVVTGAALQAGVLSGAQKDVLLAHHPPAYCTSWPRTRAPAKR
ncbi:hypothetical protein [Streptomyces viridochromogenes]|nr:hypothetical protein [Streptomyces viridochromogenes]